MATVFGNGLLFFATGLLASGIRVFDGRSPRLDTVLGVSGGAAVLLGLTFLGGDQLGLRIVIFSLVTAFWTVAASLALMRTPKGLPILSRLLTAGLLMAYALLHLFRGMAVQSGLLSPHDAMTGPAFVFILLTSFCLVVAWSLGSLFMVLDHMASHDDLTGITNRRTTLIEARKLFEEARTRNRLISVLMIDLDHFKAVNDRFGHQVGDVVLRAFARTAGGALRGGDLMGRYGGEEFCVVLPGADERAARAVAERLRSIAQKTLNHVEGHETRVTVTIGTATFDGADVTHWDVMRLINAADSALYEGKLQGRNRVASASINSVPLFEGVSSNIFA